jgi:hypothetical protein
MKRAIKVMGIIAVVALISFSFFACGDPDGGEEALGKLTIVSEATEGTGDEFDVWPVDTVLEAVYSGSQSVTYEWYEWGEQTVVGTGEDAVYLWGERTKIPGETSETYTPNKAGRYTVVALVGEAKETVNTNAVYLGVRFSFTPPDLTEPNPYEAWCGTWEYDPNETLSDNTTQARKDLKQTIVITKDSFELTDNSATGDFLKSTGNFKWNAITSKPLHSNPNTGTNYPRSSYDTAFPTANGYRLTATWSVKGYTSPSTSGFYIYTNNEGTKLVRTNNANAYITCVYVKVDDDK